MQAGIYIYFYFFLTEIIFMTRIFDRKTNRTLLTDEKLSHTIYR